MARRDRVPRHKSHNQKKNKNPKLSPFQREQKRAKLANQAPTTIADDLNTIPHSQRRVYQYLMEKKARDDARRQRQLEAQQAKEQEANEEAQEDEEDDEVVGSSHDSDAEEEEIVAKPAKTKTRTPSPAEKPKKKRRIEAETLEVESDSDGEEKAKKVSVETMSKKQRKKNPFGVSSLNAELIDEVAPKRRVVLTSSAEDAEGNGEDRPLTLEERIAKKKLKKHLRKSELRRQNVSEKMLTVEAQLAKLVRGKGKKGREDENTAFERKLRQMQLERAREVKTAKLKAAAELRKRPRGATEYDADGNIVGAAPSSSSAAPSRKRISFDDSVESQVPRDAAGTELPHHAMQFPKDNRSRRGEGGFAKPTDFYEMVDVVRFGERVVAPPVFDVVPNRNAAITKLANKLDAESAGGATRHRLLSGGGGLGEQKRLARMGLAPAITGMVVASNDEARRPGSRVGRVAVDKESSQAKEMSQLRAHVMAAYQNSKRKDVETRKGVNMRHEFPRLS